MGVGDDMNKEIKKQLILSFVLLTFVVATLFFWYQNFIFHTYGEKVDYQYCLYAQNEEWQIAGYEFYQKGKTQGYGHARLTPLQPQLLKKNDETIFGLVIDYNQNDVYYAFNGQGAFCNNERLKVSNNEKLCNSILSFCLTSHYNEKHIRDILRVEESLASKVRGLRLIVSGAIELCWCASGKIDGVINVKPSIGLSSAAGKLFVKEAGGKITNLKGNKPDKIDTLLVTNGKIHNEVVETLKNAIE